MIKTLVPFTSDVQQSHNQRDLYQKGKIAVSCAVYSPRYTCTILDVLIKNVYSLAAPKS